MDRFLENNTVIKGLAFLLAFMLWMVVTLDEQPGATVQEGHLSMDHVKLDVVYDEEIYEVMEMDHEAVEVILSGRRALLNLSMLRSEPYRVYVDLTGLGEGKHRVPVQQEGFPTELRVEIVPRYVNVTIEKKEAKSFPLKIEVIGKPKEGYTVEPPTIELEQVHVIGPSSVLEKVSVVKGLVDVDKAEESFSETVQLQAYDRYGNKLKAEISPNEIETFVKIKSPSKRVPFKLTLENSLPTGLSLVDIKSHVSEIEVFAPLKELEKITVIEGKVDLSKITTSQTISLALPLEREWEEIHPKVVNIDIKVTPTQTRELNNIPIKVIGLDKKLDIQFVDPDNSALDLTLLGSEEKINQVNVQNLDLRIDVSQLKAGEHTVKLLMNLPEHVDSPDRNRTVKIIIKPVIEAQEASGEKNIEEQPLGGE